MSKVDPEIMNELLEQPGVKEQVARLAPEMLEWLKQLLVEQGIYARYLREREERDGAGL